MNTHINKQSTSQNVEIILHPNHYSLVVSIQPSDASIFNGEREREREKEREREQPLLPVMSSIDHLCSQSFR